MILMKVKKCLWQRDGVTMMFESFIQDYERRDKQKTANTYFKLLSQFEKWLDGVGNSGKFGKEDVLDFLKTKDWANSSKNVFLSALSSWANSELEDVQPPTNDEERREVRRLKQIKGIKSYHNHSEEKEPLSLEEIVDLRMSMGEETKQIFWTLLWFGLRVGELNTIENIDYENQSLTVSTLKRKNHERTLYFDDYTGRILQNARNRDLFKINYNTLYRRFKTAGKRIGVDLTPHICRHTFASQFGERTDSFSLAKMLGHSVEKAAPSRATGKYVHPSEDRIKNLMLENHYLAVLEVKKA